LYLFFSCLLRYGSGLVQQSCMSVCINKMGNRLLALRRRLPAVLYDIKSASPLCEFDHAGYYNSCTMKSCSFAGDKDQVSIELGSE
jgi:WD repeat-containing protein 22